MSTSKPTLQVEHNSVDAMTVKRGLTQLRAAGQPVCSLIGVETLNPLTTKYLPIP